MALSWSFRRQALYYIVAAVVAVIVVLALWKAFFVHTPLCTDGIRNGSETGVDCGGSCSLICADVARDPVILWRLPFKTGVSTYTVVAYLRNPNANAGAKSVPYSFSLFDDQNILIAQTNGTIDLPPVQIIPIVDTNINVGTRVVSHVEFAFGEKPVWHTIPASALPSLRASAPVPNDNYSRVSTTIFNDSVTEVRNTTVAVIVFSADGTALAASKSFVNRIPGKSSQSVVFTWPIGAPTAVRAEVRILPSF